MTEFDTLTALVASTPADELVAASADVFGSEDQVLDLLFTLYQRNILVGATMGVHAGFQFFVETSAGHQAYLLEVDDGNCRVGRGLLPKPTAILRVGLGDFLQLSFGRTSGGILVSTGRLEVTGDMFATMNFPDWFITPGS